MLTTDGPFAESSEHLGGWITGRNRATGRLRCESRGRELLSEVAVLSPGTSDPGMPEEAGPVEDDRLRLIFTCCHPALSAEAQAALALRLLGGLSTTEVARSFLVTDQTMAVRLVRAKRKITAARIPCREITSCPARAYCLLVITTARDHITAITSLSTSVITRSDLPRTLPGTD